MNLCIYKYTLQIGDAPMGVDMPSGAIVRAVGQQDDPRSVVFWAEVDPDAPREQRTFVIRATGRPFAESDVEFYLGTVQDRANGLVWHLYEVA